jgi:hypothetical protein
MRALILCLLIATAAVVAAETCQPTTLDLFAGQTINVGSVSIINTDSSIQVKLTVKDGWTLSEVHIYAGTTSPSTVAPGQFPFSRTLPTATTSFVGLVALVRWFRFTSNFTQNFSILAVGVAAQIFSSELRGYSRFNLDYYVTSLTMDIWQRHVAFWYGL